VTSLAQEVPGLVALPTLEALAHRAARQFGAVFGQPVEMLETLDALRSQAQSTPDQETPAQEFPAPEFPAQDTPLQVPPKVERLRQLPRPVKDRPIPA